MQGDCHEAIYVFAYDWNINEADTLLSTIQIELPQSVMIGCTSCVGINQNVLLQ